MSARARAGGRGVTGARPLTARSTGPVMGGRGPPPATRPAPRSRPRVGPTLSAAVVRGARGATGLIARAATARTARATIPFAHPALVRPGAAAAIFNTLGGLGAPIARYGLHAFTAASWLSGFFGGY